jgi:hypothetical protein
MLLTFSNFSKVNPELENFSIRALRFENAERNPIKFGRRLWMNRI